MITQTMVFGIILSVIYYELVGLSPGGMIVSGYLVLYLNQPGRIIATILISLLVFVIGRVIDRYTILYGRQKYGTYLLLGILINWFMSKSFNLSIFDFKLYSIGVLIPGIIAIDMDRQGIYQTLLSMGIVIGVLYIVIVLFSTMGVGYDF